MKFNEIEGRCELMKLYEIQKTLWINEIEWNWRALWINEIEGRCELMKLKDAVN